MEETLPPGKPRSLPQASRTYCWMVRLGSIARADRTQQQRSMSPANSNRRRLRALESWEVFKLINDNLGVLLDRTLIARHYI